MRAARRPTGFFCKGRPLLYSASRRLAYLKTPKAASLAIQDLFQKQFPDYRWTEAHEPLPNGTVTFTFVREPVKRVLSAYGEIDVAYALRASPEARKAMHTAFDKIHRNGHREAHSGNASRLLAFLDDLVAHRFGGEDRAHWMPTHAYPQLNFLCNHRIDFIGRLEQQDADWAALQDLARIPPAERTPFPHGHGSSNKTTASGKCWMCEVKLADEQLPASPQVLPRLCDVFASDFHCLGYPVPPECRLRTGTEAEEEDATTVPAPTPIDGVLPLPASRGSRAAPVYVLPLLDADEARRWLAAGGYWKNTLFVLGGEAENRTTLYRIKRAANASFAPPKSGGAALLREYDRFGWYWRPAAAQGTPSTLAPLAVGVPLTGGRDGVEHALAEAQQLLLLHRYDRVVVVGRELSARANASVLAQWLVDPIAQAAERAAHKGAASHQHYAPAGEASPTGGAAGGPKAKPGGGGTGSPSPPHKHFLPGR